MKLSFGKVGTTLICNIIKFQEFMPKWIKVFIKTQWTLKWFLAVFFVVFLFNIGLCHYISICIVLNKYHLFKWFTLVEFISFLSQNALQLICYYFIYWQIPFFKKLSKILRVLILYFCLGSYMLRQKIQRAH